MEREKSWEKITQIGNNIRERWQKLADRYELKISHRGIPALASFSFESKNDLYYKTLISQEMLSKGYLAANSVYVCTKHTSEIVDGYFEALDKVFSLISDCERGRDVNKLLKGDVCHNDFKRLN
jgi:glutamate-1-semialdehyde 2,1-aminomutase